jgi:DNA polymerase III epsilon subunit-like protein
MDHADRGGLLCHTPLAPRGGATTTRIPGLLRETPFAVVDVETTGFSPLTGDRIVEIAVVRLEAHFTEEYVTLVNPLRDVGPVHVHGLTAEDVAAAPMFEEIVGDLLEVMRGAVMVAHNIRFERDFVSAEFSWAGVFLPQIPSLCTLELAYKMEPSLLNHRLASCCAAAGVPYYASHTALGDARAEADLLRRYLLQAEAGGMTSIESFGCVPSIFPSDDWPDLPRTGRRRARTGDGTGVAVPYLARLVASLGSVQTSEKLAPYMDLLDRVLEDSQVTEAEAGALRTTADQWGLSMEDVLAAHHDYLESLVAAAVEDGRVTTTEHRDLEAVAHLLAVDSSMLEALLVRGMEDRG